MKKIFVLLLIILSNVLILKSQIIPDGFYTDKNKQEFIWLKNDSILLKIFNEDAFSTYSLFFGAYAIKKHSIILNENLIPFNSFNVTKCETNDDILHIYLYYMDNSPLIYTDVFLEYHEKKIRKHSDEEGYVFFYKHEIEELLDKYVLLKVSTLGFEAKDMVLLSIGECYSIKAKFYNFISYYRKKIKIKYKLNPERIEINHFNNRKVVLNKISNEFDQQIWEYGIN